MTDNITPNLTLDEPAAPSLTLEQEAPAAPGLALEQEAPVQPDGQTQAAEALKPRGADALAEESGLSAEEKQALLAHQELLQNSGVEVDDYGGFTVVVRAVPADVPVDDVGDMVLELANHLLNGGRDALREKTEWVLHSIACRAAIKAGDRTTTDEMLALAQKIMDGSVPPFCPHGRPCVLKLTRKELEKQFGRLV